MITGPLSYSQSLDDKLDSSIERKHQNLPQQKPAKQRSPHASFKLPVVPVEMQAKTNSTFGQVPAPKLLIKQRLKGPQLSLDFEPSLLEPVKLSPMLHRNVSRLTTSKDNPVPRVAEKEITTVVSEPVENQSKKALVHVRSLDELLTGGRSVVLELTKNKRSKYSHVVITASLGTLNGDQEQESHNPVIQCLAGKRL